MTQHCYIVTLENGHTILDLAYWWERVLRDYPDCLSIYDTDTGITCYTKGIER